MSSSLEAAFKILFRLLLRKQHFLASWKKLPTLKGMKKRIAFKVFIYLLRVLEEFQQKVLKNPNIQDLTLLYFQGEGWCCHDVHVMEPSWY